MLSTVALFQFLGGTWLGVVQEICHGGHLNWSTLLYCMARYGVDKINTFQNKTVHLSYIYIVKSYSVLSYRSMHTLYGLGRGTSTSHRA